VAGITVSSWLWLSLGVALLLYEAFVIFLVVRSHSFSRRQKVSQIVFVALLPPLGAVVAHWFATQGSHAHPVPDRDFIPQERPTLGQR
jgi:uncharacterized membrane protein